VHKELHFQSEGVKPAAHREGHGGCSQDHAGTEIQKSSKFPDGTFSASNGGNPVWRGNMDTAPAFETNQGNSSQRVEASSFNSLQFGSTSVALTGWRPAMSSTPNETCRLDDERRCFRSLIRGSRVMRMLFERIELAAVASGNLLIEGESGTGKELRRIAEGPY
jgi:hypothetical protein